MTKPKPDSLDVSAVPRHATLMLGDLHGTRQIPAFVGRLVATLVERDPVVLALEIPHDNTAAIDAYLASDGSAGMRKQLLAGAWWQAAAQDGRRSVAMADLLETVRVLRHAGKPLVVVLIDAESKDQESREEAMANNVLAARREYPGAALVVYAGSLHTSKGEVAFVPGFAWMAMRVAKAGVEVVSLNARFEEGTAWICGGDIDHCGVGFVPGRFRPSADHLLGQSGGSMIFVTCIASPSTSAIVPPA